VALYIAPARRRRRILVAAVVALIVGLGVGLVVGRVTAPTLDDRIGSVQNDARQTAARLRVIALHDEAGTGSSTDDQGTALVIERTGRDLEDLFDRAPWLGSDVRRSLHDELDALAAQPDTTSGSFGEKADDLAAHIEQVFNAA